MTNKEAKEILRGIQTDIMPSDELSGQRTEDVAFDMAIKALEERSTGDLISREALKEALHNEIGDHALSTAIDRVIENAPTFERPQGEWEAIGFEHGYAFCICSNCHKTMRLYRDSKNEFCCIADIRKNVVACMYCGADMRGEEE